MVERESLEAWTRAYRGWPDRMWGPYEVGLTFALVDGRVECVGVDVRSFQQLPNERDPHDLYGRPPFPITTSALRSLRLGELINEVRDEMEEHPPERYGPRGEVPPEQLVEVRERWRTGKGGRPPTYPLEHWVEVARVYNEANMAHRTPTRAVRRRFGISATAAAKWVARCRALGLLPPTSRGKARGTVAVRSTKARRKR